MLACAEADEDRVQLVFVHVDVLVDAAVEHRGRDVAAAPFLLRLVQDPEHDALAPRQPVAHVGQVIEVPAAWHHRQYMRAGWVGVGVLLAGCGARSDLFGGWPPSDAGPTRDGEIRIDAGPPPPHDAGPPPRPDTGPPETLVVECSEPMTVMVGASVVVDAAIAGPAEIVDVRWRIASAPPESRAPLVPAGRTSAMIAPELEGEYVLELTAIDAEMRVATCVTVVTARMSRPPVVMCPPPITTPTRRPVTIRATASDDFGIASMRWSVITAPAGSTAAPRPLDSPTIDFTPDRAGAYVLRFTVTDVEGFVTRCDVMITATPTPPEAMCPRTIDTTPLTTVEVTASALDDGSIVSWSWRLASRPAGSAAAPPSPANAPTTRFTPDIAGEYQLEVTVTDDTRATARCVVDIRAIATEGIRVEMFWDTMSTDMDTHMLSPLATEWFGDQDCYYANCQGMAGLEWGGPGDADNPHLDIDDTDGFGPENINLMTPAPGTYRVGVHSFSGNGRMNRVTVRIYCGGSTTMPRLTLGPATITSRPDGTDDFWRVADITIDRAGGCRIAPLTSAGGGFDIRPRDTTSGAR